MSEAVQDTPLAITIPRGIHSGGWPEKTERRPEFETLQPDDGGGAVALRRRQSGDHAQHATARAAP